MAWKSMTYEYHDFNLGALNVHEMAWLCLV